MADLGMYNAGESNSFLGRRSSQQSLLVDLDLFDTPEKCVESPSFVGTRPPVIGRDT